MAGKDLKLILVTGMPGSGKSIVSGAARCLGLPVYVMGDVIREEARRRGLEPSGVNLGRIAVELRRDEGEDTVARRMLAKIWGEVEGGVAVVEGLRSLAEYDYFRLNAATWLVAVHASPETRFARLSSRGRSDDPRSWEEFEERDRRELRMGIGSVIALAQSMLVNEGVSKECFAEIAARELRRILSGWDA